MTSNSQTRSTNGIDLFQASEDEPLGLALAPGECPASFEGSAAHRFEFSSRGDRVAGRLLLPETRSGPCPLVVALGAAGEDCDSSSLDFLAELTRQGFAIATLDLSLHGERKSAKFSERLIAAIADAGNAGKLDPNGEALLVEFTRQSVSDVRRTLDALTTLPAIDANRVAFLGTGHGAALMTIAASTERRAKGVVLANRSAVAVPQLDPDNFASATDSQEQIELASDDRGATGANLDAAAVARAIGFLTNCLGGA